MSRGLIMSEAVMMALAPYLGREYAHDVVYDLCRRAIAEQRSLEEMLLACTEITAHLDESMLTKICDPANYLGMAGNMVDAVLAAWSPPPRLGDPG